MIGRAALAAAALALPLAGCGGEGGGGAPPASTPGPTPTPTPTPTATPTPAPVTTAVTRTAVATLSNPWAMVFLPDGRLLVTERGGALRVVTLNGTGAATVSAAVSGVPAVAAAGQGGLLDVALDPAFASNGRVYLSYAESGSGGAGLAVARATLSGLTLTGVQVIWRQAPKVTDTRHFGGRMAFAADGRLFVTAGERHLGAPAQDLRSRWARSSA